jgi:potassium channel subfamily K, other eukaryote
MGFAGSGSDDNFDIRCVRVFLKSNLFNSSLTVLSEAYSSRYKNVLSKGSFERAVKNFRERRAASPPPHARSRMRSPSMSRDVSPERGYTREHAKRDLEALPSDLLSHAKTFHEHIYYFMNNGSELPPQTLTKLLDEIAESEHMDARLKQEMLGDDGARKVRNTTFRAMSFRCAHFSSIAYRHYS